MAELIKIKTGQSLSESSNNINTNFNNINSEIGTPDDATTASTLYGLINKEQSERSLADEAINRNLSNLTSEFDDYVESNDQSVGQLETDLAAEIANRTQADTDLTNSINSVNNSAVHKTGDETISGTKTFTGQVNITGNQINELTLPDVTDTLATVTQVNTKQDSNVETLPTDSKTIEGAISEIYVDLGDATTNLGSHISNTNNPHAVTKSQVGLGNVDNTSDANKPVSTAQQAALDLKVDKLTTSGTHLYAHNGSTQNEVTYGTGTTANAIPQRDVNGQIAVPATPTATSHATSKSYVDSADASLRNSIGDVSDLSTTSKVVVPAINELYETIGPDGGSGTLSGRITALESWRSTDEPIIDSLNTKVGSAELNTESSNISDAINELYESIGDNTGDSLSGRVTALESWRSTDEPKIDNLETKVGTAALTTTAQNLSAAINELVTKTNTTNSTVSGLSSWRNTATSQISALETASDQHDADIGSLESSVSTLNSTTVKTTGNQSITGSLTIVKSGTSSTGNLVVQGDLTVQGTTITESHESLTVQDNIIVTNGDGNSLTQLSGLAIRKNSTDTYGIMYDPTTDSVSLGLGTLDASNEFTFDSDEGLPIVVRDNNSSMTNGNLIQWSTDGNKIIDAGIARTNVATLSGTQTFSGAKTFNNISAPNGYVTGTTTYDAGSIGFGSYTLTLPSKTGTLATLEDIPDEATLGNGTITITQGGTTRGSFTVNQTGNTTISLTDNNTTYSAGTGLALSGTTFSLDLATTTERGGGKVGAVTTSASGATSGTTSGRNYAVQRDSNELLFVNVPWTDNNTTYSAGAGLSLSGTTFSVNTGYTTSGRNYKVQVDSTTNGLYVNVPWTDNNTTYSVTTSGSGNAVTSVSLSGTTITATKGSTFALSTHTHAIATTTTAGFVKPVSVITTPTINTTTSTAGRYYNVQMNTDGNMFVNVPWTDNNTTYTVTTTGSGNAVTNVTLSGTTITATKDSTFSLSNHTHSYLPLSGGTVTGSIVPNADSTLNLGSTNVKWANVYGDNFVGNASTATTLATARNITIGNTTRSFNGSANISWTLSDIGAAASSHNHSASNITSGTLAVARGGTGVTGAQGSASQPVYLSSSGITACTGGYVISGSATKSTSSTTVSISGLDTNDNIDVFPADASAAAWTNADFTITQSSGQLTFAVGGTAPSSNLTFYYRIYKVG